MLGLETSPIVKDARSLSSSLALKGDRSAEGLAGGEVVMEFVVS